MPSLHWFQAVGWRAWWSWRCDGRDQCAQGQIFSWCGQEIEQISKYSENNESQVFHCQIRELGLGKWEY